MTFFFAAFCGAFAGYDFGGNWWITILFGLIWGLLVYSIDQMMVQTIDKVYVDNLSVIKKFAVYFFPRLFLGILLALFMSSPLDHFLFEGQIKKQMQINADATWMRYQKELKGAMDIEGTQNELNNLQSNRDSLIIARSKYPNTVTFREAKDNYDREYPKLRPLEVDKNNKNYEKNGAWSKIPEDTLGRKIRNSKEYNTYLSKETEYKKAVTVYNNKNNEVKEYEAIRKQEIDKYQKDIENKIAKQDTLIDKSIKKLDSDKETIDVKTEEKKEFLEELTGFDTKFMTLLMHPDFGVQFLRWFIFLVFLMIEILPTWMKLMGKPKDYDIKLDEIKNEHVKEIQYEHKNAEIQRQFEMELVIEQEKQRKSIELDNHKKILEQIAEKQYDMAQMILNEWVEKNKNDLLEE
jgi:hypothetical protein